MRFYEVVFLNFKRKTTFLLRKKSVTWAANSIPISHVHWSLTFKKHYISSNSNVYRCPQASPKPQVRSIPTEDTSKRLLSHSTEDKQYDHSCSCSRFGVTLRRPPQDKQLVIMVFNFRGRPSGSEYRCMPGEHPPLACLHKDRGALFGQGSDIHRTRAFISQLSWKSWKS